MRQRYPYIMEIKKLYEKYNNNNNNSSNLTIRRTQNWVHQNRAILCGCGGGFYFSFTQRVAWQRWGVSKSEQKQTNTEKRKQTQRRNRKEAQANTSKRGQTQTNAYSPLCCGFLHPAFAICLLPSQHKWRQTSLIFSWCREKIFPRARKGRFEFEIPIFPMVSCIDMGIFWLETPLYGVGGNGVFRLRNPLFPILGDVAPAKGGRIRNSRCSEDPRRTVKVRTP